MNIAITIWGHRVSPVFDASQKLLIARISENRVVESKVVTCNAGKHIKLQRLLQENEVELFICGAICEAGIERLKSIGVQVAPFLAGETDQLLEQYIRGEGFTQFSMPGCGNRIRCRERKNRYCRRK